MKDVVETVKLWRKTNHLSFFFISGVIQNIKQLEDYLVVLANQISIGWPLNSTMKRQMILDRRLNNLSSLIYLFVGTHSSANAFPLIVLFRWLVELAPK